MSIIQTIKNRWFLHVMHSGNERKKGQLLKKRLAHVGKNCRIYSDSFGTEPWLIWLGNDIIVASGVAFIEHDASYYTAYRYLEEKANPETEKMGAIIIEDNCFIGANAIVLGGTKMGRNSILAAGAVVHGVVPPGEVWGGVPARFIMKTEEYALQLKKNAERLPWANGFSADEINVLNKQKLKQNYYFKLLEDNVL